MYLSDYIIPFATRGGFDSFEDFIFVRYEHGHSASAEKEPDYITILFIKCGMLYDYALKMYEGKYKVAFINDIPVIFDDFKAKGYIKNTTEIYKFRKWRKDFPYLITCEREYPFEFSVIDGNICYIGYDYGIGMGEHATEVSEAQKPKQTEPTDSLPIDSIL